MIFGAHMIVYSEDAAADRDFFREVLGFSSVDAGHGWLIFALPPAELAVHPAEEPSGKNAWHEIYFMCDDLKAEIEALGEKGVQPAATKIRLPGGSEVGLYQHPEIGGKLVMDAVDDQKGCALRCPPNSRVYLL